MTDSIPSGYKPLICDMLPDYLSSRLTPSCESGGLPKEWKVPEVGDGDPDMVFIVEGTHRTIIVKQALPWLCAGDEEQPLSLNRVDFEYSVLYQGAKYAGHTLIPQVHFYDPEMALSAMEYLIPHVILCKKLINGKKFLKLAEDIGRFLAQTLFSTFDIDMSVERKEALTAEFALNHELCKITEDLIFIEPCYNAERNNWTPSELDGVIHKTWADVETIQVAMYYKYRFATEAQTLLHDGLHSGSVMVINTDTKVIDPEFGFMGPMTFDIGNHIGNPLPAYFPCPGWDADEQCRADYQEWLLQQVIQTWPIFTQEFRQFWDNKTQGDV